MAGQVLAAKVDGGLVPLLGEVRMLDFLSVIGMELRLRGGDARIILDLAHG